MIWHGHRTIPSNRAGEERLSLPETCFNALSSAKVCKLVRSTKASLGFSYCLFASMLLTGNSVLAQQSDESSHSGSEPAVVMRFMDGGTSTRIERHVSVPGGHASKLKRPIIPAKLVQQSTPIPQRQETRPSVVERQTPPPPPSQSQGGGALRRMQVIPFQESDTERPREMLPVPAERVPVPSGKAIRPWLDTRPRSLDTDDLISPEKLPGDGSNLPAATDFPQLVELPSVDIRPVDVCASAKFFHKPLYFEDRYLERLGVAPGPLEHLPAVRSGVHFIGSAGALPLRIWPTPPCSCVRSGCVAQCRVFHESHSRLMSCEE